MRTIGIDLGGTKTLSVLVEDGVVVEKAKRPTPRVGSPDDVLATMAKVAASVDPDATATAIGIGAPGPVVPGTGVLPAAPNLPGWDHDVAVADLMSERLGGRPVSRRDIIDGRPSVSAGGLFLVEKLERRPSVSAAASISSRWNGTSPNQTMSGRRRSCPHAGQARKSGVVRSRSRSPWPHTSQRSCASSPCMWTAALPARSCRSSTFCVISVIWSPRPLSAPAASASARCAAFGLTSASCARRAW